MWACCCCGAAAAMANTPPRQIKTEIPQPATPRKKVRKETNMMAGEIDVVNEVELSNNDNADQLEAPQATTSHRGGEVDKVTRYGRYTPLGLPLRLSSIHDKLTSGSFQLPSKLSQPPHRLNLASSSEGQRSSSDRLGGFFAPPRSPAYHWGLNMQALPALQRSSQRRSPLTDPNQTSASATNQQMSTSATQNVPSQRSGESGVRSSSGSGKSSSGKKKDVRNLSSYLTELICLLNCL